MDSQSISFVHHGVAGQSGGIDFQRSRSRDCPMPAARSVPRPINYTEFSAYVVLLLWNLHARSRTSVREAKGGENVPRRLEDDPLGKGQAEEYEVACPTRLQNKQIFVNMASNNGMYSRISDFRYCW